MKRCAALICGNDLVIGLCLTADHVAGAASGSRILLWRHDLASNGLGRSQWPAGCSLGCGRASVTGGEVRSRSRSPDFNEPMPAILPSSHSEPRTCRVQGDASMQDISFEAMRPHSAAFGTVRQCLMWINAGCSECRLIYRASLNIKNYGASRSSNMRLLAASLLIAPYLVSVMTVSSMAQPGASQTAQYQGTYQPGPRSIVPRRAVNTKDRSVQSIPSGTRQGCRHLYSGGPKTVVPHTC